MRSILRVDVRKLIQNKCLYQYTVHNYMGIMFTFIFVTFRIKTIYLNDNNDPSHQCWIHVWGRGVDNPRNLKGHPCSLYTLYY